MSERLTQLVVVRHGETDWNAAGKIQGVHDTALSPKGVAQIRALGAAIAERDFDGFYCSDLKRARETAAILNEQLQAEIQIDHRLRERDFGHFQGLSFEEIQERFPDQYQAYCGRDPYFAMTNGQSHFQQMTQVNAFLADMTKRYPRGRVLAVAHSGSIQCMVHAVLGIPLQEVLPLSCENATMHAFEFEAGRWVLRHWDSGARI